MALDMSILTGALQDLKDQRKGIKSPMDSYSDMRKFIGDGQIGNVFGNPDLNSDQKLNMSATILGGSDPKAAIAMLMKERERQDNNTQDLTTPKNVRDLAVQYRSLLNAVSSTSFANLGEDAQDTVRKQLKGVGTIMMKSELGRALMGEVDAEFGGGSGGSGGSGGYGPGASSDTNTVLKPEEDSKGNLNTAVGHILAMVKSGGITDGLINNIGDIDTYVLLQKKYGLALKDDLEEKVAKLKAGAKERFEAELGKESRSEEKRRNSKSDAMEDVKQFSSDLPAMKAVEKIDSGNANRGDLSLGTSQILKYLSGTGVSDTERINTLLALTTEGYQKKARAKGEGYLKDFVKKFIDNDQEYMNEIINNIDPAGLKAQLNGYIPKEAWAWYNKTQKGGKGGGSPDTDPVTDAGPMPLRSSFSDMSSYAKAVKAWKAKGGN